VIALVGNKCDVQPAAAAATTPGKQKQQSIAEAQEYAESIGAPLFQVEHHI
jgi:hypothetical protein